MSSPSRWAKRAAFSVLIGTLAALLVFSPLIANLNGTDVLYIFLVAPALIVLDICVLMYAAVRKNLPLALLVVVFGAVSASLFFHQETVHIWAKWFFWSNGYRNAVLAEPASKNGDLRHIEWDGWGWAGSDTSVFLVFDPSDSLSKAATNDQSGKVEGIPCEVSLVRRMSSQWYLVYFEQYVDESAWRRSCGPNPANLNRLGPPPPPAVDFQKDPARQSEHK